MQHSTHLATLAKKEAVMPGIDLFKEVIAPISTIILSAAAIAISWFFSSAQARTAKAQIHLALDKLNFDVFGKRYEIYEVTRSLIDRVKAQDRARLHPTELRALGLKLGEACFFFDKSTQMFLKEVWTVSDRILLTRDQRELVNPESDEERWLALGKQLSADNARLSEMYSQLLPVFEQAMALTQLVKERAAMPRQ
jgi:hypothetical protein